MTSHSETNAIPANTKAEATHMSAEDIKTIKTGQAIKNAVAEYRKTTASKVLRNRALSSVILFAALSACAYAADENKHARAAALAALGAFATASTAVLRDTMEKETKIISDVSSTALPYKKDIKTAQTVLTVGQAAPLILGTVAVVSGIPEDACLAGAMLAVAEMGKTCIAATQRKLLERHLGLAMPAQYRLFKQNSR